MTAKLLCIGDLVGSPGRRIVTDRLAALVEQHDIDCTIVNAENVASGSGITPGIYQKLLKAGVQLFTLGDHIYRRKEIIPTLETSEQVVRPANLPNAAPGRELAIYETGDGTVVAVFSLLGRLFMKLPVDCPFKAADRVLSSVPDNVNVIVCDIHAEATSEKVAMGWHLDGRVSLVFGTHTHVATADERVLPRGTGYITDLGMTGPHDSVLGRDKQRVLRYLTTGVPNRFDVATDDVCISGVVAEVNPQTGHCQAIYRISVRGDSSS